MTTEEFFGKISGIIVTAGIFPYVWRVWRREITVNLVSWLIWLIAVFALVANYKVSGATENVWPAYFSCFNVTLIVLIALFRGKRHPLHWYDWVCFVLGIISIAVWVVLTIPQLLKFIESHVGYLGTKKEIATYALCIGILADAFAAVPTFLFLLKEPWEDRPFAWLTYSFGYSLSFFAITEHTFANYVLPVYMTGMAAVICYPLIKYRIQQRIPIKQWI